MFQEWHPSSAEIAMMVILAILPLTIPVSIFWRCAIWAVAWALFLHLFIWQWKVVVPWPLPVKTSLAIGLTGLLVACTYVPIRTIWREEKAVALSGELEVPVSNRSDVVFQIGAGADGTEFNWTGGNGPIFNVVGSKLSIRRENGKLLLSVDVRERGTGSVVVSITDNKWTVSSAQSVSWDHNYTSNALEVKDGRGRVVFQVVLTPETVRIQGEWWHEDGNGGRIVRPYPYDAVKTGPVFVIMTPIYHPDEPIIEPIFKYPSKEHWGEFADWFKSGKENVQAGSISLGPGSIAQIGGAGNQATVNNYGAVDRHLSPSTANALGEIAQSIPNKDKYPVGFLVIESGEAETFADEIAMAFYKQGVGVGRAVGGRYWSPQTPKGVIVAVKAKEDSAFPLAERIANAMGKTGVPAVGIMLNPNGNSGQVLIIVGEKTDGSPVAGISSYLILR